MKKFSIKLTKEQREQIKKRTGANVRTLSLVQPTEAMTMIAKKMGPLTPKKMGPLTPKKMGPLTPKKMGPLTPK